MLTTNTIFQQWLLILLALPANAAAALPLIIILGIVAGRRGNAVLCLEGNLHLGRINSLFAVFGPIYYALQFFSQMLVFGVTGSRLFAVLIDQSGRGYFYSIICSGVGMLLTFLAVHCLGKTIPTLELHKNKYNLRPLRLAIFLFLLGAVFSFACFCLINWPFAGLPEGMEPDRAAFAILRNSFRRYFMAFGVAGGLCLVFALYYPYASSGQELLAKRWLAAWGAAGFFPHALVSLGLVLGLTLRGNSMGDLAAWLMQMLTVFFMAGAIICWAMILFGKSRNSGWIFGGFICLLLQASASTLVKLVLLS